MIVPRDLTKTQAADIPIRTREFEQEGRSLTITEMNNKMDRTQKVQDDLPDTAKVLTKSMI